MNNAVKEFHKGAVGVIHLAGLVLLQGEGAREAQGARVPGRIHNLDKDKRLHAF